MSLDLGSFGTLSKPPSLFSNFFGQKLDLLLSVDILDWKLWNY